MSCLEVERTLLAAPSDITRTGSLHVSACGSCGRLAAAAADFDRTLGHLLEVPIPDSLADRILLRQQRRGRGGGWMAAAVVAALLLGVVIARAVHEPAPALQMLGAKHPAVAAIAEVDRERHRAGRSVPRPPADAELRRAGLNLPAAEGRAEYVGACRITGGACEHIVIVTARERANVLLMPDLPKVQRMLVADRRMIALVNAARNGGFIVVADSPEAATRVEQLLLRSAASGTNTDSTEAP